MRTSRLFILFALILMTGCSTASPTPQPTSVPPTNTPPPPTQTPEPPTQTPAPTPTISVVMVIDDFEAAETAWVAGMEPEYTDSSSTSVALTAEHASQGNQALQFNFDKNDKPKAIFYLDKQLDLSGVLTLRFDIFSPGMLDGVAVGFNTGAELVWYESNTFPVTAGQLTTIIVDLTAGNFKAASTNWEFRTPIADLNDIRRLAIIIFPVKRSSVFLDNMYVSDTPKP